MVEYQFYDADYISEKRSEKGTKKNRVEHSKTVNCTFVPQWYSKENKHCDEIKHELRQMYAISELVDHDRSN